MCWMRLRIRGSRLRGGGGESMKDEEFNQYKNKPCAVCGRTEDEFVLYGGGNDVTDNPTSVDSDIPKPLERNKVKICSYCDYCNWRSTYGR